MKIGYARISTPEQSLDLQRDALTAAGCEKIFEDVASGAQDARPGLAEAIAYARAGDTLVVWQLDRLGRSQTLNRNGEPSARTGQRFCQRAGKHRHHHERRKTNFPCLRGLGGV